MLPVSGRPMSELKPGLPIRGAELLHFKFRIIVSLTIEG
jgi:hypothetical protein